MSLLAGQDVTVGLADVVAKAVRLAPLDLEATRDLLHDTPLAVRCVLGFPFGGGFWGWSQSRSRTQRGSSS